MEQLRHLLKELRFVGGRFEENKGWLDFDVLPELEAYKRILIGIAKEEWRRRHPGRERLPKGFEEGIRLGFREVREGSCAVPIERIVEVEEGMLPDLRYIDDEIDEAARIIDETLIAAGNDAPFPERLPTRILPLFEEWGKTLGPDEAIVLNSEGEGGARFDAVIKLRILQARSGRYEDRVDREGEVRAAELKAREGGSFTLQLDNGDSVVGTFTSDQESIITDALHQHDRVRLHIVGTGEFEPSGRLRRIVKVDHLEERSAGEVPYDSDATPIWEEIVAIGQAIPDEEWENVPSDLSINLDHYLYGKAKKDRK
jgi:hypothetical protein